MDLAWFAHLDVTDRAQFWEDLQEALQEALLDGSEANSVAPVEKCLREWRTTAEALTDPQRREVLTATEFSPGDFVEVGPPATDG